MRLTRQQWATRNAILKKLPPKKVKRLLRHAPKYVFDWACSGMKGTVIAYTRSEARADIKRIIHAATGRPCKRVPTDALIVLRGTARKASA